MSAETAAALREAKALIDSPEKWIKGDLVRIIDNRRCYCALGAIDQTGAVVRPLLGTLPTPFRNVAAFNDDPATTHADVMALFDRAIAAEEVTS